MDLFHTALKIRSDGLSGAEKALARIDNQGKALTARFGGLQKAITGVASAAAVVAVGRFLKTAIGEAIAAEQAVSGLRQSVDNAGGSFALLEPTLDAAANRMAKLTRFSDDAARGALTRMVQISGDTKGALDNLGLAADIAAAKHVSLEEAAGIVGKTMAGNTRGLREFGITTKDSAEAMEQLRQKFRGMAEGDANTLQGRLEQIRNAWGEVLEAAGKVFTGTEGIPNQLAIVTQKLNDLSTWIDSNAEKWRSWGTRAVDSVKGVEDWLNKAAAAANRYGAALHNAAGGNLHLSGMGRGGGGGGGRDGGPGSVPNPQTGGFGGWGWRGSSAGHSTPPRRVGTGAAPGEVFGGSLIRSPGEAIGLPAAVMGALQLPTIDASVVKSVELINESGQRLNEALQTIGDQARASLAMLGQTLADGVYNAFAAGFNGEGISGIFKAFGKTVLAGLGDIFAQQGAAMMQAGIILTAAKLGISNPFTAGPAMIAAGAALTALGAAFGAIANGGGGRGTASAGAFREPGGTSDITRLKFVERPGMARSLTPLAPAQYVFIGANDPTLQREFETIIAKASRR